MSSAKRDTGGGGGGGQQVSVKDERKLKPIFDLVDEGNYKQAISQLDKFLKRSTSGGSTTSVAAIHQAKALKCLCLWRMPGRQQDATQQANALIKEGPEDEGSLSVFALCLRDMRKNGDIEQLYSKAVDKNPKNEDLINCLIMAHVRTDNFKMQQVRSLQLNKLTASPNFPNTAKTFYLWAVMAVFLQAKKDKQNGMKVQLPLARKMMEKSVADSLPIGATKLEQVDLLLMILEELKDYKSALQVFKDNITVYDKELPVLREKRKVEYLDGMADFNDLVPICKDVITAMGNSADWFFFEKLINAYVHIRTQPDELLEHKNGNSDESNGSYEDDLSSLVEFLLDEKERNQKCIGHHFALLHLRKMLDELQIEYSSSEIELASMSSLVLSFYHSFGHKSPFFNYVRPCLTTEVCESFVSSMTLKMSSLETGSGDEAPLCLNDMYSLLSICEVERTLSREKKGLTEEQCLSRSETMTRLYRKYLPLGVELQSTEPQFSSKFIILASHYLIDAYMLSDEPRNQTYLWAALDRLKEASVDSPVDSQLLMVMMRIYQQLGLLEACCKLMDRMQIKQFLLQTTCWVLCNRLSGCGFHAEARLMHPTLVKYIQSSVHQVPDYLIQGYRNGVYRKIVDMLQWKQSLLKSYSFIKCIVEELMLDIVEIDKTNNMESRGEEMCEFLSDYRVVMSEWDEWSDDRDLDLHYSWEPLSTDWAGTQARHKSYKLELSWLKSRYTLVSSFAHLICTFSTTSSSSQISTSIFQLSADFKLAVSECLEVFEDLSKDEFYQGLQGHPFSPFSSPVSEFVKLSLDSFYCQLIESFASKHNDAANGVDPKSNAAIKIQLPELSQSITAIVHKISEPKFLLSDNKHIKSEDLVELKLVCEAISMYVLCVGFVTGSKKKQKCENESANAVKELLEQISEGINKLIARVNETEWIVEIDVDVAKNNLNCCLSQINNLCTAKIEYLKNMYL